LDAIAAEAPVGKGTLFRRFGDRASLALMEDSDRALQAAFIRGPAPLGPGATIM
jgi:AcrR family transcriptional regulator